MPRSKQFEQCYLSFGNKIVLFSIRNQRQAVTCLFIDFQALEILIAWYTDAFLDFNSSTARVFSRDSPWIVAQWTGRPIRESWGVLWLVIRLLSVRADVSSSVRSILPCTERLYRIPLHTCQHAGALPATTNTSPTPRRKTVRTKYYYCSTLRNCRRFGIVSGRSGKFLLALVSAVIII
jgi:hypothetical protein